MPCLHCGVDGPTLSVRFGQNIGMLYARRTLTTEGELCRPCIGMYFRSYTLTTLFLGWWGLISLFIAPVMLLSNIAQYLRAKSLPEPGLTTLNIPFGEKQRLNSPRVLGLKIIYGIVVWGFILGLIAYNRVEFMEKHAPLLNAKLHGGEITEVSDAEYVFSKVGDDIAALEADVKGQDWAAMRAELIARQDKLEDLVAQNAKLQRRLEIERNARMGANDNCERWALNEVGPALNIYAMSENALFGFVKSNAQVTEENRPVLNALTDKESQALGQLRKVLSDDASKGCNK